MAPLAVFGPIDEETLNYLATTGRTPELIHKVAAYTKANHLFYDATEIPDYTKTVTIDLAKIQPALAGPKRPQDRILLPEVGTDFDRSLTADIGPKGFGLSEKEWQKSSQVNWPNDPSKHCRQEISYLQLSLAVRIRAIPSSCSLRDC